jgi:hypothetical protein
VTTQLTRQEWLAVLAALAYCTAGSAEDAGMSKAEFAACATALTKVVNRLGPQPS